MAVDRMRTSATPPNLQPRRWCRANRSESIPIRWGCVRCAIGRGFSGGGRCRRGFRGRRCWSGVDPRLGRVLPVLSGGVWCGRVGSRWRPSVTAGEGACLVPHACGQCGGGVGDVGLCGDVEGHRPDPFQRGLVQHPRRHGRRRSRRGWSGWWCCSGVGFDPGVSDVDPDLPDAHPSEGSDESSGWCAR